MDSQMKTDSDTTQEGAAWQQRLVRPCGHCHGACSCDEDWDQPSGVSITIEAHRAEIEEWKTRVRGLEMYHADPASTVTESLANELKHRDAMGRRKYQTSLDRSDLSLAQWAAHAKQEALDQACYLERVERGALLLDEAREIMQYLSAEHGWDCAKQWLARHEDQFAGPNVKEQTRRAKD
jgi:hypothetical protein